MAYGVDKKLSAILYVIIASGVPKGEWGSGPPTFSKYDSRDLSKNAREFYNKGVSPHLREFEGRDAEKFSGLHP